jgi:sulfatase modifying factor 1
MKNMKKLFVLFSVVLFSCTQETGELVGVRGREAWFQPDPFGTLYIPMGSYHMGPSDEQIMNAHTEKSKMVSVQAFYIDETEISNNEYRQFVYYVRDSLARTLLAQNAPDPSLYQLPVEEYRAMYPWYKGDANSSSALAAPSSGYYLNWEEKIKWNSEDDNYQLALDPIYLPVDERYYNRKEIDSRKLNFLYYRIDIRKAAQKSNRFKPLKSSDDQLWDKDHKYKTSNYVNGLTLNDQNTAITTPQAGNTELYEATKDGQNVNSSSLSPNGADPKNLGWYDVSTYETLPNGELMTSATVKKGFDRSVFIVKDIINVYPDTLAWVHDYSYSFNEPMTNMYFWHPAYDDYPVVGVTWKQARAFCVWRSFLLNNFLTTNGMSIVNDFRLPTESEWEYAARGGKDLSPYPWGGPYIRNARGCFLGNFKPLRGSYTDDGGFHTVSIFSYNPNDYGLYCMAGNAAEWTSNAFDESAYDFAHDLNPDYVYEANDNDPNSLKRKVIRGGSWKDIGYYMQNSARAYEYQDTAKCYIGFRCVMTYLGRQKGDDN